MSGRYVPPQRRVASGGSRKNAPFQRETFSALKRTFTGLANRVSFDNVQNVAVEVFRENVVRGRGLFCDALLRTQQFNPELTQVFAALVAIVNRKIPRVGLLMLKRLVVGWRQRYRRRDWNGVRNVNIFVGHLYCMNVCSEGIVLAIIDEHLKDLSCTDHDVDLAIAEIDVVFRVMMERSVEFRTNLLEPLRQLLLDENQKLSPRASTVVEGALQKIREWETQRHSKKAIPEELMQFVDGITETPHDVGLKVEYDDERQLNEFVFDAEFDKHEAEYDEDRKSILGENWEEELLAAAEEGDESEHTGKEANTIVSQEQERSIREQVNLIIRSSARADEMAHKILRSVPRGNESITSMMVVESCCQEQTYKKAYALLSERLCKASASFQISFVAAFHAKYASAAQLSERQIDLVAVMWAHLLRTDSIRWNSLAVLQLLTNEASCRLMIQALLRTLERDAGVSKIAKKLLEPELSTHLRGLLPQSDASTLQLCVDLYEAMGVQTFASKMRLMLQDALNKSSNPRKRGRE